MINKSKLIIGVGLLALLSADVLAFDPHEALRQREQAEAERQRQQAERQRQQAESRVIARYEFLGRDQDIVRDKETGLQWMRCSLGQTWQANTQTCSGDAGRFNYNQALQLPELMNEAGGYAGYTDWRVPTIEELHTLVFCSSGQPAAFKNNSAPCSGDFQRPTIVIEAFPNTALSYFWSASPSAGSSADAWYVFFRSGSGGWGTKGYSARLRLVRGGQ